MPLQAGTAAAGGQGVDGSHALTESVFIEGTHRVHETVYFDEVDEPADPASVNAIHSSTHTRAHASPQHAMSAGGDGGAQAPSSAHTCSEVLSRGNEPAQVPAQQKQNAQRGACILERMKQLLARSNNTVGQRCAAGPPAPVEAAMGRSVEAQEPARKRHCPDATCSSSTALPPRGVHRAGAAAKVGCTVLISEAALRAQQQTARDGGDGGDGGEKGKGWRQALILSAIYDNADSAIDSFILALAPRGTSRGQSSTPALQDSGNDAAEVVTVPAAVLEDAQNCIASAQMLTPQNYHGVSAASGQHPVSSLSAGMVDAEQMLLVKSAELERDVPMPDASGAPFSTHTATLQPAAAALASQPRWAPASAGVPCASEAYVSTSKPLSTSKPKTSMTSSSSPALQRTNMAAAALSGDALPAASVNAGEHNLPAAPGPLKSSSRHPAQKSPGMGPTGAIVTVKDAGRAGRSSAFTPVAMRPKEPPFLQSVRGGNGGGTAEQEAGDWDGDPWRAQHVNECVGAVTHESGAVTAGRNGLPNDSRNSHAHARAHAVGTRQVHLSHTRPTAAEFLQHVSNTPGRGADHAMKRGGEAEGVNGVGDPRVRSAAPARMYLPGTDAAEFRRLTAAQFALPFAVTPVTAFAAAINLSTGPSGRYTGPKKKKIKLTDESLILPKNSDDRWAKIAERVIPMVTESVEMNSRQPAHAQSNFVLARERGGASGGEGGSRPRMPCRCKKSRCLRQYCVCFRAGVLCVDSGEKEGCLCTDCRNDGKPQNQASLDVALIRFRQEMKQPIDRINGCRCRNSGCIKKYCECFAQGAYCTEICLCQGCKNADE